MSNIYGAYLEDYHQIKIILKKGMSTKNLSVESKLEKIDLHIYHQEFYGDEHHIYAYINGLLNLQTDYTVKGDAFAYFLKLGKITRSPRFNLEFSFKEWLGFRLNGDTTTFRIWTPVSKEVKLILNEITYDLSYYKQGVWEVKVPFDASGLKYHYKIRVNEEFAETNDPYAIQVSPDKKESVVFNLATIEKYQDDYYKNGEQFTYNDAVIEEVSIRDLTSLQDIPSKGTFKAAIDSFDTDYGFGYLKQYSFTHFQIMPVFDFGGVNDLVKDYHNKDFLYNWGYNPLNYQALSLFLASDVKNPIPEFKRLIKKIHDANFGVVLDVVFNHVYDSIKYPFNTLCPGYAFITDTKGFLTNFSGCGNDLNTSKKMVRKLIIDTLIYFQKTFKIDGFRFDLMGLVDMETLKLARKLLLRNNPNTILYGEGWKMNSLADPSTLGTLENTWAMPDYAFFNDQFRNQMKGSDDSLGFLAGAKVPLKRFESLMRGSFIKDEIFVNPSQSLNYIECHDNSTFVDSLRKVIPNVTDEELTNRVILGLGIVCFSVGIPFYNLGQELFRTKKGIDNSYNCSDDINGVTYDLDEHKERVIKCFKEFLNLRKTYKCFREANNIYVKENIQVQALNTCFLIKYYDIETNSTFDIIFKNNYEEETYYFAPNSKIIFASFDYQSSVDECILLNTPSITILKK